MKIWKKVTALVLSLAMTLSASATVLAQAPSIKEGHVTTTASVTNDGIYINGKYYTKVQFKHLLNKAQKTETVQPYDLGDAGALIAGTWWIPGIGEVIVTTAGLVIVAGVIYGVGTWVYDTVTQWFAERAEQTSVYKGYKQDKIEMRGDRAEMSDFPLYLNTVAGGLDRRDQTIGGFSFVVKIYAVPVVEIIG